MSYRIEIKFKNTEIGLIPEDWEIKELNKIGKIITGKTPPTKNKEYFGKLVPFITPRDMLNNKFIKITERYLSKEGKILLKNIVLPENSICVSCIGSDMGKVAINEYESITNQQINSIISRNLNYNFVYYSLFWLKKELKNLAYHSTAIPILNKLQFSKIKICIPSIKYEIDKISEILSSLDEKIGLNNKINNSLEQISQLLFKHWFLDFEFPNEQGKPYKSSGDEFIDSELGKIPKGWEICKLLDCGKIVCGKTPPKSNKNYFGGNIPFIKIPDMHNNIFIIKTEDSLTEEGKKFQENKNIPVKSIIVSCIATVGLVSITSSESQTNQQINSLIPLYEPSLYYLYFKLKTLKDYFNTLGGSGSTTLNVNTKIFSNVKVIMPTNNILEKFNKVVSPIFNSILLNSRENLNLSQIRDTLLPKLITGKIRVNLEDLKES